MRQLRQVDWVFVTRKTLSGASSLLLVAFAVAACMQAVTQISAPGAEELQASARALLSDGVLGLSPQDLPSLVVVVCMLYVFDLAFDFPSVLFPFGDLDRNSLRLMARASRCGLSVAPNGQGEWVIFSGGDGPVRINSYADMEELVREREVSAPGDAPPAGWLQVEAD